MPANPGVRREDPLELPLLLFFTFSAAGWLWEVLFVGLSTGRLVNRGFFHGPWLPVYGVGGLLMLLVLGRVRCAGALLFPLCALLGGGVEYAVSVLTETLFHARWWDYGGWAGSLDGRVCLASAAAFGAAGWLLVRYAGPRLCAALAAMPARPRTVLCRALCVLFALDAAASMAAPNTGSGIAFPL